jgi:hypothetical protein
MSHNSSPFCSDYFEDGVLRTIFLGWPWTVILPISASRVVRITGVSCWHWLLAFLISIWIKLPVSLVLSYSCGMFESIT